MECKSNSSLLYVFIATALIVVWMVPSVYAQTDWTKDPNNPVLDVGPSGEWDDEDVITGSVILEGTTYHMWYGGYDGSVYRVGYATSPDGVDWTKVDTANPVLNVGAAGSWDDAGVALGPVLFDGTTYHMWYLGYDGTTDWRTGYATSDDGVTWTKDASNPVLDVGAAGSWDDSRAAAWSVLLSDTTYHMWYTGGDGSTYRIGYATSDDGVTWTKDNLNNPVLLTASSRGWDDSGAWAPAVVFDGTIYHMWYGGYDGESNYRIGYATDSSLVGIEDYPSITPSSFVLQQNYPNPFNPVSTIRYDLPEGSDVSLIVYDILGREMMKLVDGYMEPGHYQAQWDGRDANGGELPSGLYLARLVTPGFTKSIKMVLLK